MSDSVRVSRTSSTGDGGPRDDAARAAHRGAGGRETAAVPLLQDLSALLGLVPTIVPPDGPPGGSEVEAGGPSLPARSHLGRRPLAPDLKTRPFSVRLTASERALVHRAALLRGPETSVAAWARAALLDVARDVVEAEGEGEEAGP